jgi:hypothetical protein
VDGPAATFNREIREPREGKPRRRRSPVPWTAALSIRLSRETRQLGSNLRKQNAVSSLESFFAWFAYFAVVALQISSPPPWFLLGACPLEL